MKLDVTPTAGMLWPGPMRLALAGRRCRALELRVRHVARLERAAARLVDHPFRGMEDDLLAVDTLPVKSEERQAHLDALWDASDRWPPRLGSAPYWRVLSSGAVAPLYLGLVLRATRPRIAAAGLREMAGAMTAAEWRAVDAAAHGHAPSVRGEGDGRGLDWRAAVRYLADPRGPGLALAAIGDLYLSQLFFLIAGPEPTYSAELPDRPVSADHAA